MEPIFLLKNCMNIFAEKWPELGCFWGVLGSGQGSKVFSLGLGFTVEGQRFRIGGDGLKFFRVRV